MATLVIRHPDGTEEEVELTDSLTVGRAEGNDLILSEGGVSRRHARFFIEAGHVHVEDVESANGTWVDGERIEGGPFPLGPDNQVQIGDYELSVKASASPKRASGSSKRPRPAAPRDRAPSTPSSQKAQPAPRKTKVIAAIKPSGGEALARRPSPRRASGPQLRGIDGPLEGKIFALSGTMNLGRVGDNDIVLDDDSVSRRHAELEVSDDGVLLRDLGSANGTTVNGGPIAEGARLAPGDVIQLGVVSLMFENAGAPARALARGSGPRRRGDGREAELVRRAEGPVEPRAGSKKRLMIVGGAVGGLLLVLVIVKLAVGGDSAPKPSLAPPEPDPETQIEALLTECRTYSSPELGKPDWARAKVACEKIIELEPIHADANALVRRIQTEKTCEDNLQRGKDLVGVGRLEDAVEAYAKVGANERDCPTYYLRALDAAKAPVEELKAQAGRECKDYSSNGKWENAYRRCEVYMRLACQVMDPTELLPPPGQVLRLDGHLGRGDWRPANPLYLDFLKARERLKPGEPMWLCPSIRAFRPPPKPKSPDEAILKDFRDRFHSNDMGDALFLYFKGKENEAQLPLHKILETMSRASEHDRAKALLQDIAQAQNLFQSGSAELANERPERAAIPFRQALAVDERLILGERAPTASDDEKRRELERRASYLRRMITEQMATVCYTRGKTSADRNDFRQACRHWKLGLSFSRSNIDLLRALTNVCTSRAQEAMRQAGTCVQLKQVIDFAVDGDGYQKQAEAKADELGCTPESR